MKGRVGYIMSLTHLPLFLFLGREYQVSCTFVLPLGHNLRLIGRKIICRLTIGVLLLLLLLLVLLLLIVENNLPADNAARCALGATTHTLLHLRTSLLTLQNTRTHTRMQNTHTQECKIHSHTEECKIHAHIQECKIHVHTKIDRQKNWFTQTKLTMDQDYAKCKYSPQLIWHMYNVLCGMVWWQQECEDD